MTNSNTLIKISYWAVFGLFVGAFVLLPFLTSAQIPQPDPQIGGQELTLTEVENLVRGIARFLIIISIVIAIIFIVIGGIMYMIARGDEEAVGKAKATIKNGIIGALVVLAVGVILNTLAAIVTRTFFGGFTS